MNIWNEIVQSNTFNFIVLVLILYLIIKFCKINLLIENAQNKVKELINNSTEAKEKSIVELKNVQETTSNIQNEINEIEQNGDKNITLVENKINEESNKQVETIKQNTEKLISAKERDIVSNLSKKTILASIELAKKHVINLLETHPEYHQNFINDSVQELDRQQL